jgi:hypothetical protein
MTEWRTLLASVDPDRLLNPRFTWFFSAASRPATDLENICIASGILDEKSPHEDTRFSIVRIAQHPPLAGSLGILPPDIQDFYRAYFYRSRSFLRHKNKELMELVQETIASVRLKAFELSFKIWLEWRRRKRKLLARLLRADKVRRMRERAIEAKREIARSMESIQQARAALRGRRTRATFRRRNPARFRSRPMSHNFYLTPPNPLTNSRQSRLPA